ncbi:MAG: methyltransferase family protein [Vicinamibacterales bacterium]
MTHLYYPALLIGLIVGTYWARVLKMVLKQRRQTGRDANFVPREAIGRVLRIIWYPVVVLWVVHPLVSAWWWADAPRVLTPLHPLPWLAWTGVVVAALALAATWVCWRRMGKSWRMGIDPDEKTQLIFTGPYAYVRHPIYALSSLLMLATLAAVPTPLMVVLAVMHLLFLQWEASREEKYLVATHGEAYAAYRSRVGRFLPRSFGAYRAL